MMRGKNKQRNLKVKEKPKVKGIHSYTPEARKVRNAKEECKQKNCSFYKEGCKPCRDCKSESNIITLGCQTCFDCEYKPNSLRWNNDLSNEETQANSIIEEMEIKEQLVTLLARMEAFRSRNKQNDNNEETKPEQRKISFPMYVG